METFIPNLIGWMIVLTCTLSTISFGYMGYEQRMRRPIAAWFAWACTLFTLMLTGLTISLVV